MLKGCNMFSSGKKSGKNDYQQESKKTKPILKPIHCQKIVKTKWGIQKLAR